MSENTNSGDSGPKSEELAGLTVVIEYFSQEMVDGIAADHEQRGSQSSLTNLLGAVAGGLKQKDLPKTRLVITGDLVSSVNDREDRTDKEFTMQRGSGIVAAKTMPPSADGLVDILVPVYWLLSLDDNQPLDERDEYIQHVAAHEAVHASLFHIGDEPFDLHHREEFGHAMSNFVSMSSEQTEEHLAEFLGSRVTGRKLGQTAGQVSASIDAWQETLSTKLPSIPGDAPDYFQQGMLVAFEALHVLWKTLAYLAAALRTDEGFDPVPLGIADLPGWKQFIGPWWPRYFELLGKIPMTVDVDIQSTDEVVRELALHLQSWADDIGFDFHDTAQGGFFRIKIWD